MRDRLNWLLREEQSIIPIEDYRTRLSVIADIADYLIDNGVIVLPCKVGQTVYRIDDKQVYDWWQVEHIEIYADETVYVDDSDNTFTDENIGKTVFLTRE